MNFIKLATKYGVKLEAFYALVYNQYFNPIQHEDLKFLELGVESGRSIRLWHEFFSKAHIYGVDIDLGTLHPELRDQWKKEERVHLFHGFDATDPEKVNWLAKEHGPFDIIIDDASHEMKAQQDSLKLFWPHLLHGGLYFIEDTCTSYWDGFGGGFRRWGTTMEFLKSLIDVPNLKYIDKHTAHARPDFIEPPFDNSLVGIHFYESLVMILKGERAHGSIYAATESRKE